ncbi:MAG: thymidylate kinase [Chloroflexi bacterium]|nr:thymidylate kinase [Chloroflexota bacterium]MBL7201436.1 thymidylate kinase [Anaerolineae bacterium]
MTRVHFYGHGLPGLKRQSFPGRLIVLEGTDGVGRSTQVALLREWLESSGYAVASSGLKRSDLAGKGISLAQQGHYLGDTTSCLFYATDLADRLEREIIPALRAGFVVLTDRYIYSVIARVLVRGLDRAWVDNVFGFALVPDKVFYLRADLNHLIPRVLNARGFNYWEAGMDFLHKRNYYESYVEYQSRIIDQFDAMAGEFNFHLIDATRDVYAIFTDLEAGITKMVKGMRPSSPRVPKKKQ